MSTPLLGIHHVTALAKSPRENHEFYTGLLGLRLVKKTVNFDDPLTYHLYYGDAVGSPGTLLTHFPHPLAKRGVHGSPEIRETVLAVAPGSLEYWIGRFEAHGIAFKAETTPDQDRVVFDDPHGMRLGLVEAAHGAEHRARAGSQVPAEHSITGIDAAVIHVPNPEATISFLETALGFVRLPSIGDRHRVHLGRGHAGGRLEIVEQPASARSRMGAGTVHHIAWRVPDDAVQAAVAERIREAGIGVTPVMDRQYFRSIYFRIPGGVIFEVATDGPGFDMDEPAERLGEALQLPPQYESRRAEIEAHLLPLDTRGADR